MAVLFRFLARLPLPLLHNLGALLGWLVYFVSPTYRRHLRDNTAAANAGALRWAAIAEAGKCVLELPKIWLRPQTEVIARVVRVSGWALVEAAWAEQRAILFLTPHLGCFEIAAQYYAAQQPMTVLYREPKQAWLRPLMVAGRGAHLKLASADPTGVRQLLKALRRREAVGILPDQVPGRGEGVWSTFFGRPAYTMTLAARLAEGDAQVILIYAERLPYGAGYHLRVSGLTAPLSGTLTQRVGQLNRELERLIGECPAQYLWGYNRYKTPPGTPLPTAPSGEGQTET